jgi:DNA repair protein RecN (Recombination protein N)
LIREINIQNFALIEDISLELDPGLNIFTGETGAGKSMVVDAVAVATGRKGGPDLVRAGESKAVVEIAFEIPDDEFREKLGNMGIDVEEDILIIRREITASGRTRCFVNRSLVTVSTLSEMFRGLIEIHGQHEHQAIFSSEEQMRYLDRFGGLEAMRAQFSRKYDEFRRLKGRYEELVSGERERGRRLDMINFQIDEIEKASLVPGEDEELEMEASRLRHAERLIEASSEAYGLISGVDVSGGAIGFISKAMGELKKASSLDPSLSKILSELQSLLYRLEDISIQLRSYRDSIELDPERLLQVEERLDLIKKLKRKYGDTIEEILSYKARLQEELLSITRSDEEIEGIGRRLSELREELSELAAELSKRRAETASILSRKVEEELPHLGMAGSRFEVVVRRREGKDGIIEVDGMRFVPTYSGIDEVEFLIAPNVGEDLMPLSRIASGGEISRTVLALRSILSRVDNARTLIFDEIDVGIGGRVAEAVGRRLKKVAEGRQVICVTHLPQIASFADAHFRISKEVFGGRTRVLAELLGMEGRIEELARMIGGEVVTDTTRRQAMEMIEHARGFSRV